MTKTTGEPVGAFRASPVKAVPSGSSVSGGP
jgi:hypothetical protein